MILEKWFFKSASHGDFGFYYGAFISWIRSINLQKLNSLKLKMAQEICFEAPEINMASE